MSSAIQRVKDKFRLVYWPPENRRWMRILHAICMSLFCIYSAGVVIYFLAFSGYVSDPPFMKLILILAWGYLIAAIPIGLMLYRNTNLRKYERIFLTLFIMLSSTSLLLCAMVLLKSYA